MYGIISWLNPLTYFRLVILENDNIDILYWIGPKEESKHVEDLEDDLHDDEKAEMKSWPSPERVRASDTELVFDAEERECLRWLIVFQVAVAVFFPVNHDHKINIWSRWVQTITNNNTSQNIKV